MFLIVGLGNPGAKYARTRHNVGWLVLDELARRHNVNIGRKAYESMIGTATIDGAKFMLAKPQTYMNLSGRAVRGLKSYFRAELSEILVVTDDLNLPLGRLRLRASGSDGGHNGLKSITQQLATSDYARLRFGVNEPPREERRERGTADHVLSMFEADEWPVVEAGVLRAADCAEVFMREGIEAAMNRFNKVETAG